MTIFYPDLIRIKIAASEADFEAGELWGRKASAASFSFPKFPSLKISLGGRNLNPFTFGIESSFSFPKVYDSHSAPRTGIRREGSSRPVFVHIWEFLSVFWRNNWIGDPKEIPTSKLLVAIFFSVKRFLFSIPKLRIYACRFCLLCVLYRLYLLKSAKSWGYLTHFYHLTNLVTIAQFSLAQLSHKHLAAGRVKGL